MTTFTTDSITADVYATIATLTPMMWDGIITVEELIGEMPDVAPAAIDAALRRLTRDGFIERDHRFAFDSAAFVVTQ